MKLTLFTRNEMMVHILWLEWTKLVVPSIGSRTQVGVSVSSHFCPPATVSSPINLRKVRIVHVKILKTFKEFTIDTSWFHIEPNYISFNCGGMFLNSCTAFGNLALDSCHIRICLLVIRELSRDLLFDYPLNLKMTINWTL